MKRVIGFIFVFIFIFALPSFADDLIITNWNVESNLLESGDLQVSEDITFRFDDEFNGIFRDIVLNNTDGIEGLEVYELIGGNLTPYELNENANIGDSNVYSTSLDGDTQLIQVFSPSEDEDKTFRFSYTLNNVAIVHSDTGEFYYKYLGEENETFIEVFTASLTLPEFNRDDIYIFGHGPLDGLIEFTQDNRIILSVENVASNNFIEARVLYPRSYTPLSNRSGDSDLNTILEQERVHEENIEAEIEERENLKTTLNYIALVVSGLGAILVGFLYRLNRRDPKIFREMNNLLPEDISPAELNLFRNMALSPRSITATIFDLARREYLTIEDLNGKGKKLNLIFTRSSKNTGDLSNHESYFIDWLFNHIGEVSTSSTKAINHARKKSAIEFNKKFQEWQKIVKEELQQRNYYDKQHRGIGVFLLILGIGFFIFGIISAVTGALYGIALIVIAIAIIIFSIVVITRLSDKGYIQKKLWDDFNKEVKDKSRSTNVSDKHLVYALAMDNSVDDIDNYRSGYSTSYFPLYWGYFFMLNNSGGSLVDDSVNNSFYGYTGSSSSSGGSFGGGGGFSAGGGGGAGGGGAGGF